LKTLAIVVVYLDWVRLWTWEITTKDTSPIMSFKKRCNGQQTAWLQQYWPPKKSLEKALSSESGST